MEMPSLKPGDVVEILSPASVIEPQLVDGAVKTLRAFGFEPRVSGHSLETFGSFSGTSDARFADLERALCDPDVRAILCSRGGYGCVHLLPQLDRLMQTGHVAPKWLIGFSDITALHALWWKHGLQSLHSSMAKHLANYGPEDPINRQLVGILAGKPVVAAAKGAPVITFPLNFSGSETGRASRRGVAEGEVVGGNLAVLGGLIGTPFCPVRPGSILLIEDIAEPIYKVERILWQLRLAGIFDRLAGLIVGQFTDYRAPSKDHRDMYEMITKFLNINSMGEPSGGCGFPVAMDVAVGHVDDNRPLILNRRARFEVGDTEAVLTYI